MREQLTLQQASTKFLSNVEGTKKLQLLAMLATSESFGIITHDVDERIARRVEIAKLAENGKIAVVESGMDCDCVQYDGVVRIIDAKLEVLDALYEKVGNDAEGPFNLRLIRVSESKNVKYRSRDRALEAYEDGHPYAVVYGSMDN